MSILLIRNDQNYQPWIDAIQQVDTDLKVVTPETIQNRSEVTMALTWKAPAGSFEDLANLKVIGSMGAGVDHLFDDSTLPQGLTYTRIVDNNLSGDMAEFVLGLCMRHIKNFGFYQEQQVTKNWKPISYRRNKNVTVGIMGMGVLGKAVANLLISAGFKVCGWSQSAKRIDGVNTYKSDELNNFLSQCNILVCLLPLTDKTRGIINADLLSKLKQDCYLINVARGGHVVDDDLLTALENNQLSGAALDVFHEEPLPSDHPFWNRDDILITPHVASVSSPASVADQVVENYRLLQQGKALHNRVSIDQQY
ncbi:2-hydroxyacid dehydrogenase [Nonlabens ponticola]|uniref:Glyoxylate/hydroxypyruvate reductase A n=1 Tax=Nonlabens ponticola TaxID=2496866 RepID=A0A3S9MXC5_9FLAO|nr:glyoxylate/hydroxypyruvate reductase A [Nonlabens ponticola]AZQ43926.1 glyoxylate/hydroxypyruvate reductase A [Nonlabens ponticola]